MKSAVVWFPDSRTTAYTSVPAAFAASARGVSPKMLSEAICARVAASKTFTRSSLPPRLTKARLLAKTTSFGSSPTATVATSFRATTSTTLTVSERWFTTQTSFVPGRSAVLTGSRPTGTSPTKASEPSAGETSKMARRPSGVLTA